VVVLPDDVKNNTHLWNIRNKMKRTKKKKKKN